MWRGICAVAEREEKQYNLIPRIWEGFEQPHSGSEWNVFTPVVQLQIFCLQC
jgi:hypothetical protein